MGGGGGWKDGTSTGLTSPKMRGLDRDRGGLFDFLGGVGRFGQSKNYFHRWEKSRSGALFTIYRGQFSVFALSAAGIFQSLTPLTPPRKILKSNDSPHKHTNFN